MQEFDELEKEINVFNKSVINELKAEGAAPKDDRLLNASFLHVGQKVSFMMEIVLSLCRIYQLMLIRMMAL